MVVLVIKHPSKFTSYIIALSLLLFFEKDSELLRIIIVEAPNFILNGYYDTIPWCGINTINDMRFRNVHFINFLLERLVRNEKFRMYPLDKICPKPNHLNYSMDIPMNHSEIIEVSMSSGNYTGIVYHPGIIIDIIKQYLFNSRKVSFFSMQQSTNYHSFVNDLEKNYKDNIVMYDFPAANNFNNMFNISINSNLSTIIPRNKIDSGFPHYILWLPKFRDAKGNSNTSYQARKLDHKFYKIDMIEAKNYKVNGDSISQIDLLQILHSSDQAILATEHLFYSYNINTFTNKL